jgi:hypothetical protein
VLEAFGSRHKADFDALLERVGNPLQHGQ